MRKKIVLWQNIEASGISIRIILPLFLNYSTIPKLSLLPPHSHQKMVKNYCSFIFGEYLGYNFEFFQFIQQLFIQHLLYARLWGYKDE